MERAIAYIRVSTDRQVTDGTSLITQEARVHAYIQLMGYELDRLFIEEGETAKTAGRPALREALTYARRHKGRLDVLIFPKVDRFARYTEDYFALKGTLRDLGIRLESIDERFDASPAGRFMETVLAAQAQFDNEVRSERSKNGMIEAVRAGRWVWKAPLGYRNVRLGKKGTIEPDPRVAPLVIEAFRRVAIRLQRPDDVWAWFKAQGIPISRTQFHYMLRNPAYMGVIEAFGERSQAQPPFVPLVPDDLFCRAAAPRRLEPAENATYHSNHPDFPLRGTIRCGCGRALTGCWSRGRDKRYAYYRCMACKGVNLPVRQVERRFEAELRALRPAPEAWPWLHHATTERWAERHVQLTNQHAALTAQITEAERLQGAIAMKNAAGILPDSVAKTQIDELANQVIALKSERSTCQFPEDRWSEVLAFAKAFLDDLAGWWRGRSLTSKKKLQAFLYPNGLVYTKIGSFRTADYPLLEEIKTALCGGQFTLVDLTPESTNQLCAWLTQLHEAFGTWDDEGEDIPIGRRSPRRSRRGPRGRRR
jgi:site-specific DNA recombinase